MNYIKISKNEITLFFICTSNVDIKSSVNDEFQE